MNPIMNSGTTVKSVIQAKMRRFAPTHLEVVNESFMHSVPEGTESHFNITLVSEQFAGKTLVARHRMVNQVLAEELAGTIHALALHTLTPDEWFENGGQTPDSPPCLGGSKS
ncbi:BolA family protein [Candidatus Spongiihabitans sp.]|uniref:BolA family protein n=1 Tax=Candidatus Spongiihabitans sp. TaxID=3101308 RepID=UPI003C6F41F2